MSGLPSRPGGDVPKCAQEAAEAIGEHLGRLQGRTYGAIHKAGLRGRTAHEAARAVGKGRASIQPRISELKRKGLVVANGLRRRNPSGKTATVWIASEHAVRLSQPPAC